MNSRLPIELPEEDGNPYAPPPLSENFCDVETLQDLYEQWRRCVEALVEATVVVGIVAILASLLLPAVNASRYPNPTPVWLAVVLGAGICTPLVWWGLRFFRYLKAFVALVREINLSILHVAFLVSLSLFFPLGTIFAGVLLGKKMEKLKIASKSRELVVSDQT